MIQTIHRGCNKMNVILRIVIKALRNFPERNCPECNCPERNCPEHNCPERNNPETT